MEGVHKGLALVDRVLEVVDQKLYAHLMAHHMEARIYAFASVLTMCACTPPLPEVLQLWDFLFAYGPHLNILCIVAQLVLIRSEILHSSRFVDDSLACLGIMANDEYSPNTILRNMPSLHAKKIIGVAMSFAGKIPEDMYAEIVNHAK
jgi:cell cycle arrest protein BUB2